MKDSLVELISELEKRIGKIVGKERLVVIAGHPGSGKTILAASICLASVYRGLKCLYISLQESREKFLEETAGVGLELEQYEKLGLFRFIKLPVIVDESSLHQVLDIINNEIIKYSPGIIVVDSASPLLKVAPSNTAIRSYLQNYFYELQRVIKGPVILVAELPFGKKTIELGDLEFISDVFLVLKHKITRGLMERRIEIRKVRGHQLTLAEIAFSVQPQKGIVLLIPPILSEISEVEEHAEAPCSSLSKSTPRILKSTSTYYEYPAEYRTGAPGVLIAMLGLYVNSLQKPVLFVTYKYPKEGIKALFEQVIREVVDNSVVVDLIISKLIVEPINPYAYSLTELNALENELIGRYNPGMVVFHDVGVLMSSTRNIEYYMYLLQNQIFYLKKKGVMVARYGSQINPLISRLNKAISDIVVEAKCVNSCIDYRLYVWGRFGNPSLLKPSEVKDCIKEIVGKMFNMLNLPQ